MRASVHLSLDRVQSISPILFEVGIPNLRCGYTLGSRSVTVTSTSDINSRKIVSGTYPILFEVGIPNLVFGYTLGSQSFAYCLQVTVTLTSGLNSRKIVSLEAFVTL